MEFWKQWGSSKYAWTGVLDNNMVGTIIKQNKKFEKGSGVHSIFLKKKSCATKVIGSLTSPVISMCAFPGTTNFLSTFSFSIPKYRQPGEESDGISIMPRSASSARRSGHWRRMLENGTIYCLLEEFKTHVIFSISNPSSLSTNLYSAVTNFWLSASFR